MVPIQAKQNLGLFSLPTYLIFVMTYYSTVGGHRISLAQTAAKRAQRSHRLQHLQQLRKVALHLARALASVKAIIRTFVAPCATTYVTPAPVLLPVVVRDTGRSREIPTGRAQDKQLSAAGVLCVWNRNGVVQYRTEMWPENKQKDALEFSDYFTILAQVPGSTHCKL